MYGEELIVDVTSESPHVGAGHPTIEAKRASQSRTVEQLVRKARDLAGTPSPYGKKAHSELWHAADHDPGILQAAVAEVETLLNRHDRQSSHTADGEWLDLITAKRLLLQAMDLCDESGSPRALL